jgi:hypothetical protein
VSEISRPKRWTALVAVAALLAACGGDERPVRPVLDQIGPAIAAVERKLGGPQQYFEINATPQLVNLFVADGAKTKVTPYVYVGGAAAESAPPAEASGNTFAASAVTFDPQTILDHVVDRLPDSDIVLFTIAGGPAGAVQYTAGVQSKQGGTLEVTLGADGAVQAVVPST